MPSEPRAATDVVLHASASDDTSVETTTLTLFLALYLLVLAFFIVLVSISSPEESKSRAVMDSLSSVFASVLPPTMTPTDFSGDEGDVLAAREFQRTLADVFATQLRVSRVEKVQPGRLMRIVLPADALFDAGTSRLRENRLPLLNRIVAAISRRPPGLRFDLEFFVGGGVGIDPALAVVSPAEIERAGAFARELLARGAPPDAVSIAVGPDRPGQVALTFLVRSVDAGSAPYGGFDD